MDRMGKREEGIWSREWKYGMRGWGMEGAGALGAPAGMDQEEARYS